MQTGVSIVETPMYRLRIFLFQQSNQNNKFLDEIFLRYVPKHLDISLKFYVLLGYALYIPISLVRDQVKSNDHPLRDHRSESNNLDAGPHFKYLNY